MSVTDTSSVRSYRKSPPQHGHWVIVTGTGCGGSPVVVAAGAPRKVKGPLPALRPDRFRLFFRMDWPCDFFPRPAAFSCLRRSLGPGEPSMAPYTYMKLSVCSVFFLH